MGGVALNAGRAEAGSSLGPVTPSPSPGSQYNWLLGVSCADPSNCVAVGDYGNSPSDGQDVIETWNGTAWSVTPSPNQVGRGLSGVSCTSPTFCVAVGVDPDYTPLIETWNGTAWSVTPSPNPAGADILSGVSCTSPTFCVAVGQGFDLATPSTLVETWNGTTWSVTASPGSDDRLLGVSCTSPTYCVAVGITGNGHPPADTVVETWNGTAWSITPSPSPGEANYLWGVSCTDPSFCAAVGENDSPIAKTLIETWDGSAWSVTPSPSSYYEVLKGVSCISPGTCVAVGDYQASSSTYRPSQTLIETGSGSAWSVTASPSPGLNGNDLFGASCTDLAHCVEVGDQYPRNSGSPLTLAERFTPLQITTASGLPPGKRNVRYSATLTASGGSAPYKWSVRRSPANCLRAFI